MDENENTIVPPEPQKSGSKEVQQKSTEAVALAESDGIPGGGLNQYPLTTVVQGIADLGIKGSSAMALLFASTKRIETDLVEERTERRRLTDQANDCKQNYFEEREKNSVLAERLRGADKIKVLQSVFLTLGGLIAGVGIRNLMQDRSGISIMLTILGMVLLVSGWFWPSIFSKEAKP